MHAHSPRLAALFLFACAACDAAPAPEPVGRIELALVTTSDSGASYQLPGGTVLRLDGGSFSDDLSLDADEVVSSFQVPVGEYTATLTHPYGFTDEWVLSRPSGPESDTVIARLISARTLEIEIEAGLTTEVMFTFQVATGEIVTFERSQLDVSFEVEEVVADSEYLTSTTIADIDDAMIGDAAPSALAGWWPEAGTTGLDLRVSGHVRTFRPRSLTRACAEIELTGEAVMNEPALDDLFEEATLSGGGFVCVFSEDDAHWLEIELLQVGGPASTDTLSDLGQGTYGFFVTLRYELATQVFDGETLDPTVLEALGGPQPFEGEVRMTSGEDEWFRASLSGEGALSFMPVAGY